MKTNILTLIQVFRFSLFFIIFKKIKKVEKYRKLRSKKNWTPHPKKFLLDLNFWYFSTFQKIAHLKIKNE